MKLFNRIGGSIALLYLVCVLFAVGAVGFTPAVLVPQAQADTSAELAKAAEVVAVVAENISEKKADPVVEQSIVDKAADKIPNWLELLTAFMAVAGAITAATPTPKDNLVLGVVRKVLDIFAWNFGGAKNAAADKGRRYGGKGGGF